MTWDAIALAGDSLRCIVVRDGERIEALLSV